MAAHQRLAERLGDENLWRADARACVRHLVLCFCPECKAERHQQPASEAGMITQFLIARSSSQLGSYLAQPSPFWATVVGAVGILLLAVFVGYALAVSP